MSDNTPCTDEIALRAGGIWNHALVDLEGVSPEAGVTLRLNLAGRPEPIIHTVKLSEIGAGIIEYQVPAGANTDLIRIGWFQTPTAIEQRFTYIDEGSAAPGDTYFVRVLQADGGIAWSSPIWAGERQ